MLPMSLIMQKISTKNFKQILLYKQLLYNNLEQEVTESWHAESSMLYIKFYRFLALR